eukprot:TRINITY_DN13548_c0_g2_i1.p1 TRINITY_DN13548_c0_g2~~TRINITY_DN13548_c0_g2_i1.p1  ORF type:complete len:1648 (+),score=271.41 TRINITY_DN13548_c0_g2_i1:71-4945(+)
MPRWSWPAGSCSPAATVPARRRRSAAAAAAAAAALPTCGAICTVWRHALGRAHVCVIGDVGDGVKCFGRNDQAQLGLGDVGLGNCRGDQLGEMGDALPTLNLGVLSALRISAGQYHSCAAFTDGSVKCWGDNSVFALGLGDSTDRGQSAASMAALPYVNLGTGLEVDDIYSGFAHNCVIFVDKRVKCWGQNVDGQLGVGDMTARGQNSGQMGDNLPFLSLGTGRTAIALCAGDTHTCAVLDNGVMKCWGSNARGELGYGDTTGRGKTPASMGDNLPGVDLGAGRTAKSCAAGVDFTCALLDNMEIKCWGDNRQGQLGLGDSNNRGKNGGEMGANLPAVDLNGDDAYEVACGWTHCCARVEVRSVKCWGDGFYGGLGLGDQDDRGRTPGTMGASLPAVDVGAGLQARRLALGNNFACVVFSNGAMKCWGRGSEGRLGSGDTGDWGGSWLTQPKDMPAVDLGTCPPTATPTAGPTLGPTPAPTSAPSAAPSAAPSRGPSRPPSSSPSSAPSPSPTLAPSSPPSAPPSVSPSLPPTAAPSAPPSRGPSAGPSAGPTAAPTLPPRTNPTRLPSAAPSGTPSAAPSRPPSAAPSHAPSAAPFAAPSHPPSRAPSQGPSPAPSAGPSGRPSGAPSRAPSRVPSRTPSAPPSTPPTGLPSGRPSRGPSAPPTAAPTVGPTLAPIPTPTASPSSAPSPLPTGAPSVPPSARPSGGPTRAPSAGPSEPPSAGPSAGPSPLPSGSPSGPPSAAPSAAPALNPSSPPTVPPSAPPSAPPSPGPSAVPTTAPYTAPSAPPSSGPSDAPSAAPSSAPAAPLARPTAPPTRVPSAAPANTPEALPSAPPSWAPSALPAPPPTWAPSAPPAFAPSAAPTNGTASPSSAPTAAPPPEVAVAVAGGTADTAGAAALVAASAPAAAQAGRLTVVTQGCSVREQNGTAPDEELPMIFHPTGVEVAGTEHPVLVGCIVANSAIIAAVTVLAYAASAGAARVLGREVWQVQGMLRVPTVPVLCAAVLSQGPVYAAAKLLRSVTASVDVTIGGFGILLGAGLPLLVLRYGRLSQEAAVYKLDPNAHRGCARAWLGPGEWLSLRRAQVERWGVAFRAMLPGYHFLTALDMLITAAALTSAGLGGGGCVACGVMRLIDTLIAGALVVYALRKRPYARPLRLPIIVIAQLLLGAASLALAVGYFSAECPSDPPPNAEAAGVMLAASGLVMLAAVALDCTCVLRGIQLGRRDGLALALAEFKRLDTAGTGELSKDSLRLWMMSNRNMSEEEFERVFRKVDEDDSGTVSLREFIQSEHHFWEVGCDIPSGSLLVPVEPPPSPGGSPRAAGSYAGIYGDSSTARSRRPVRSPRRTRLRRTIVVAGAGVSPLNGEYFAVRTGSAVSAPGGLRRFRSRGGHSVVREPEGSWRIELAASQLPGHIGRGSLSSRRLYSVPGAEHPAVSRRASFISAKDTSNDTVAYFHPGSSLDDAPPTDGWSVGPRGVAPAPQVAVELLDLSQLDRHNLGHVPDGSTRGPTSPPAARRRLPGSVSAFAAHDGVVENDSDISSLPAGAPRSPLSSTVGSTSPRSRLRRAAPQSAVRKRSSFSALSQLSPAAAQDSTPPAAGLSPTRSHRRRHHAASEARGRVSGAI